MWQRWNQGTHIFEKSTDNGVNWSPLGLNASIITEGTLADARLSSNVALKNAANTFSGSNTFTAAPAITGADARLALTSGNGIWTNLQATPNGTEINENTYFGGGIYNLTNGAYPSWIFRLSAISDGLSIYRAPAGNTSYSVIVNITNAGNINIPGSIYERSRSFSMAKKQAWTPAVYTAEGAACSVGSLIANFFVLGDVLFWSVYLANVTNPSSTAYLRFTMPPGFPATIGDGENNAIRIFVPGVGDQIGFTSNNTSGGYPGFIQVYRAPSIAWPAGVGHIIGQGHYFI